MLDLILITFHAPVFVIRELFDDDMCRASISYFPGQTQICRQPMTKVGIMPDNLTLHSAPGMGRSIGHSCRFYFVFVSSLNLQRVDIFLFVAST